MPTCYLQLIPSTYEAFYARHCYAFAFYIPC